MRRSRDDGVDGRLGGRLGLFFSMYRRWRVASTLQRRAMGHAFIAGVMLGVSHYAHITARQLGVESDTVVALSSVWTFFIVAVCAAFLGRLVWRRVLLAQALARLGAALRASNDRVDIRDALAAALRDSTVELVYRDVDSDQWRDAWGRPIEWPRGAGTWPGGHDGRRRR